MGGAVRRMALATMIVAVALLVLTLATRNSDTGGVSSGVSGGVSGTASGDTMLADPDATSTGPIAASASTPNPFAVSSADASLIMTRLWSPAPATARAEGTLDVDRLDVEVTTDGRALPDLTVISDDAGAFTIDITGLEPGPQRLCLADACRRVLVAS